MTPYTRVSSESSSPVQRSQVTHVEQIMFDDASLPTVEVALAEIRSLSEGYTTTMRVATDPQGRPVLTFSWDTFAA